MINRKHKPKPLTLTEAQKALIRRKQAAQPAQPTQPAEPPSALAKVKHAAHAGVRVIRAAARGEAIRVTPDERDRRLTICRACEYWNEGGNVGLGECTHSKCGCTRFKHGLATETCPLGKW